MLALGRPTREPWHDTPVTTNAAATSVSDSTRLAVDRTRLAHERTLMAWVRTATSMISFGFTIYKFFEAQPSRDHRLGIVAWLLDARHFALMLIVVALVALTFAAIEHRRELQALRTQFGHVPRSNSLMVATFVAAFGLFALAAVALGP